MTDHSRDRSRLYNKDATRIIMTDTIDNNNSEAIEAIVVRESSQL